MCKDSLGNCLRDRNVRYVSRLLTIWRWLANRGVRYTGYDINLVRDECRSSETLFILGGGESINDVTDEGWVHIDKHDSLGMNMWPVHEFVPTYWHTNMPRNPLHVSCMLNAIEGRIQSVYRNTVIFLSLNRIVRRGFHPRVMPSWFPDGAKIGFYKYDCPASELTHAELSRTLYYRGGLSLCLDLGFRLGYKRIVLMGVDLLNRVHFYDRYPSMQWQFETEYSAPIEDKRRMLHGTMIEKGKKRPAADYLLAVRDIILRPAGVRLFVGSPDSVLARSLPVYTFD